MSSRAAIVTTLRNAAYVLDSFVAYHRAIGFEHIYLFFDDAGDPALSRARSMPGVTAVAYDEALRDAWRSLPSYATEGAAVDVEVMSRQILNIEYASQLARTARYAWLLSIDSDELFHAFDEDVATHFSRLSASSAETAVYRNLEALPECADIRDYFREVTLFKAPPNTPRVEHAVSRVTDMAPQLRPYYHFYTNGKSAFRLDRDGIAPIGVHLFGRHGGGVERVNAAPFILHYACCGFENFWTKYVTLGRFEDSWWNRYSIAQSIGPFHLEARDAVAAGREAAHAFYEDRIALNDQSKIEELIRLGLLARFEEPRRIINAAATG